MSERPLSGFRVVDLADERGEWIGRLLADLGADVVRVEPPGGARSRALPPRHGEAGLYFAYRNAGKRSVVLDIESEADRNRLHELLASADVMVESFAPGRLDGLGLGADALAERHPHLVVTSFSDFGSFGPYRDWVATDAVVEAMGGMMFKAGIPEKAPLLPPTTLAWDAASVTATYATLLALYQRLETGCGQHVDFSAMLGIAQTTDWSLPNASLSRAAGAPYPELRAGSGPTYKIYRCKGGYVRLVILSPRQWRAMWQWMGEPDEFADEYWEQFLNRLINADVLTPAFEEHFAKMTMDEVSAEAQRRGIVCTPVLRPEEVLANEHLLSRGTFADVAVAPGLSGPFASGLLSIDGERQGPRTGAPEPGEHDAEVFSETHAPRPAPAARPEPSRPLAGLRVLDFGIGGVGVECGRMLADYGAQVIKIESRTYPDFIRVITGGEMSASFASSSRSKQSFGVDLKKEEGLAVLLELARHADVVVENSSTGTMDELGVGYEALRAVNPGLVMVSSQLLGAHGAWKDWIGYGPSTQPLGGMVHLWNYDDQDEPAGSTAIFPDHLAGRVCALSALAGLIRRHRTGTGGHAEVAQIETVTGMLGDLLLKAGLEPGSVRPRGNRNERGAPWGAYPCAGEEQWCVLSVRDDDDFARLRAALGDPEWLRAPAYDSAAGRFAAQDALDEALGAWTRERDKWEIARLLQAHGVPCGPMLTAGEMLDDPHYQAWEFAHPITQPELLATFDLEGPCFRATGMAPVETWRAPQLGEHTRELATGLLGMAEAEVDRLLAAGALEGPPEPAEAG